MQLPRELRDLLYDAMRDGKGPNDAPAFRQAMEWIATRQQRDEREGFSEPKDGFVPVCPYCGSRAKLMDSSKVYASGRSYGMVWACLPCKAWVGVHKGADTHVPLGRLANAELRRAKMAAHVAFDVFWKSGAMSRVEAYRKLAEALGIPAMNAHIGMFDVEECRRVVEICATWRKEAAGSA